MQMQMTERDKRLIVMLSIIVIVVGFGWWGIRPAIKKSKDMTKELEKEEAQMQITDSKLSKLFMYEVEAEEYDERIAVEKVNYFPMMSSSEIDRYFTNMILDRGLSAYDLTIRIGGSPVKVEPYQYSALAQIVSEESEKMKNKSKDSSKKNSSNKEEDPFEYESSPAFNSEIYGVDITLRLAGDIKDLKGLIEEISSAEQLLLVRNCVWSEQVSKVNYPSDDEEGGYTQTLQTTTVLNINLTMYMCDQTEPVEEDE